MRPLPAVTEFPALPENWYLLAPAGDVRAGKPFATSIAGVEIVLYRGPAGITAYAAKCAHMGCHLKHAAGDGDGIRCAMHHRRIRGDGAFERPDGSPSHALMQPTYPVQELWGCVFVWLGDTTPTVLPQPAIAADRAVMSRYAGQYHSEIPWYCLIANGCDMEHLAAVHDRALREDPVVDEPAPGHFRIAYLTRVIGHGIADRLVKYLSGDHIRASMTVANGSFMLVQSKVWRPSFFVLSMCPDGQGGTLVRAAVGAPADRRRLLDRLRLWLTARLFISFLAKDFAVMRGLDWHPPQHPHSFGDRTSQRLAHYFATLRGVSQ